MQDIKELEDGMRQIVVRGCPDRSVTGRGYTHSDSRGKAIEDAIAAIQDDPEKALLDTYIGVKNYAGFGDQREDHRHNCGPRHGSIVFRIARQRKYVGSLDENAVRLLLAVRDFPAVEDGKDQ